MQATSARAAAQVGSAAVGGPGLRTTLILLGVILGGHTLLWWLHPFDFLDDLDSQHYARIATEILDGTFALIAHPFYDRFGVTVPTGAIYAALGIGARATTLWPLVASLLTLVTVFAATSRAFGRRAGLLAAFLLATNPVQVYYVRHLLPDVIGAAFMLGSAALLYAARDERTDAVRRPWLYGGLCALTLLAGLLTKKTILWVILFYAGVMAWDLARRRNLRFWTALVVVGTALLGLFGLGYYLATGNPARPVTSVETMHNVSRLASFYGEPAARYVDRLTMEPIRFLVGQLSYGYLFVLAVPALAHLVRPRRTMPRGARFWAAYTTVILLCFWFGTTSLRFYNPLLVAPRQMIPLLAPLAILAAVALSGLLSGDGPFGDGPERRPSVGTPAIAAAFAAGGAALLLSLPARAAIYAGLGLVLVLLATPARRLLSDRSATVAWLGLAVALPLAIVVHHEARGGVKPPNPLRVKQSLFVRQHIAPLPDGATVFTDTHSAFVLPLLLERYGAGHLRVVDSSDAVAVRASASDPAFVFLDQTALSMTREWFGHSLPYFSHRRPEHWRQLAKVHTLWQWRGPDLSHQLFKVARLALYEIDDPIELLSREVFRRGSADY